MINPEIAPYWAVMEAFSQDRLSAPGFEAIYLRLFKDDPTIRPQEIFDLLNRLFTDVDAYCSDPSLRGPDDLDEAQLKARTIETMTKLQETTDVDNPRSV